MSAATTPAVGAAAAVAVLVTPALVEDHTIVLSEPLFLALLVTVLALAAAERPRASALGLVAAAAAMVRYAGLSLVLAAAARAALAASTRRRRLFAAALAGAPGAARVRPLEPLGGRSAGYGWKGDFGATLLEGWHTLQAWLVPGGSALRDSRRAGDRAARRARRPGGSRRAAGAKSFAFALRLLAGTGLVAGELRRTGDVLAPLRRCRDPFDDRIVSPLFLLATVAVATAIGRPVANHAARACERRSSSRPAFGASARRCVTFQRAARISASTGGDTRAPSGSVPIWRKWLLANGVRYELYSDNPPALYSLDSPLLSIAARDDGRETIRRLAEILRARPSAVVAFQEPDAAAGAGGEDFAELLKLRAVLRTAEGAVFVLPAVPPGASG